jgi:hypothetical protein
MRLILKAADIPEQLVEDYLNLAWCESTWRPDAISWTGIDGGLYQIHSMWVEWARREGYGDFDRHNPVDNARLAYLIGTRYDLPRYGHRFHQWSAKPWWAACGEWKQRATRD